MLNYRLKRQHVAHIGSDVLDLCVSITTQLGSRVGRFHMLSTNADFNSNSGEATARLALRCSIVFFFLDLADLPTYHITIPLNVLIVTLRPR